MCFSTDTTHVGANCAHLLANVFLYSYEAGFIQGLHKENEQKLARSFAPRRAGQGMKQACMYPSWFNPPFP
jgi:hypothetical protein